MVAAPCDIGDSHIRNYGKPNVATQVRIYIYSFDIIAQIYLIVVGIIIFFWLHFGFINIRYCTGGQFIALSIGILPTSMTLDDLERLKRHSCSN